VLTIGAAGEFGVIEREKESEEEVKGRGRLI